MLVASVLIVEGSVAKAMMLIGNGEEADADTLDEADGDHR